MAAIEEPAGEKIVRNLQRAVEHLHDDIARVELWAGALGCFAKPIPGYGHGQTRFDLSAATENSAKAKSAERKGETPNHHKAISRIGSPSRNPARGSAGER